MATGTGNLPQPNNTVSPFDIGTAEHMNNIKSNIDALASGSGLGDASVTSSALALSKSVDGNGWTVYNFGTFKKYTRVLGDYTAASVGSLTPTTVATAVAMPSGKAGNTLTGGFITLPETTAWVPFLVFDPDTASTTFNISVRNVTSVSQSGNIGKAMVCFMDR